jgi:vancomycin resistance protein VanK
MDLRPALDDLRAGMQSHWKRELKLAERKGLEIVEGTSDELFGRFIDIYKEMVARKRFVEPNDIRQFRAIQAQLPDSQKMKIMLCRGADGQYVAGVICSFIGASAVYLFGATASAGMKSNGSYLLQWNMVQRLKAAGCITYNLNGINPARNPGTYKFKADLAGVHGRDVHFLGRFEGGTGTVSDWLVRCAEALKAAVRKIDLRAGAGSPTRVHLKGAR